jgi:hypothetical protein
MKKGSGNNKDTQVVDNNKSLISLDKLKIQFNLSNHELMDQLLNEKRIIIDNNLYLEKDTKRYDSYHNTRWNIIVNCLVVGFFQYNLRDLKRLIVQFTFDNKVLYINNNYWYKLYNDIIEKLKMSFVKILNIEIAYDTYNSLDHYRYHYVNSTLVDRNMFKPYDKKNIQAFSKGQYHIDTFYIGGKKKSSERVSNKITKEVKIYNKTKEATSSGKLYILDYFKENGLSLTKDIHRVELSMSGEHIQKYALNIENLTKTAFLSTIFENNASKYLTWYNLEEYSYRNRKKYHPKVSSVNLDSLPKTVISISKQQAENSPGDTRYIKGQIRRLLNGFSAGGDEYWVETIKSIVEKDKSGILFRWLRNNVESILKETYELPNYKDEKYQDGLDILNSFLGTQI